MWGLYGGLYFLPLHVDQQPKLISITVPEDLVHPKLWLLPLLGYACYCLGHGLLANTCHCLSSNSLGDAGQLLVPLEVGNFAFPDSQEIASRGVEDVRSVAVGKRPSQKFVVDPEHLYTIGASACRTIGVSPLILSEWYVDSKRYLDVPNWREILEELT